MLAGEGGVGEAPGSGAPRTLGRLARARRRIEHAPTRMQVRAMAHFDGREPSSYLLDPAVNFVPELPARRRGPAGQASPALHR
jgi:hypothetical protein